MQVNSTNPNTDVGLIFNFYFSTLSHDWVSAIEKVGTYIEGRYSLRFNKGSLHYHEIGKSPRRIMDKTPDFVFKKLDELGNKNFSYIALRVKGRETGLAESCAIYIFSSALVFPCYRIYFHIRLDMLNKEERGSFTEEFRWFFNNIKDIGKIEYGFMDTMALEKLPTFYFMGVSSDLLTKEEKGRLERWIFNKRKYSELVWDIYLGNLLNPKQLPNKDMVREIGEIVGKKNMQYFDNLLMFVLPVEVQEWMEVEENAREIKLKLLEIFKANKTLMVEGIPQPVRPPQPFIEEDMPFSVSESPNQSIHKGPTYVEAYLVKRSGNLISKIEKEYGGMTAYGVIRNGNKAFKLLIDEDERYVTARDSEGALVLYDPSRHPANAAYEQNLDPQPKDYKCKKCGGLIFEIAVGYEYPEDSEGQDDISWFALAGKCLKCGKTELIFEDETA